MMFRVVATLTVCAIALAGCEQPQPIIPGKREAVDTLIQMRQHAQKSLINPWRFVPQHQHKRKLDPRTRNRTHPHHPPHVGRKSAVDLERSDWRRGWTTHADHGRSRCGRWAHFTVDAKPA